MALAEVWVGNNSNQTRIGTPTRDEYYARGGADHLEGRGGSDLLKGEAGWDSLYGGDSGPQFDFMRGGNGNDHLEGAPVTTIYSETQEVTPSLARTDMTMLLLVETATTSSRAARETIGCSHSSTTATSISS